MATQTRVVLDAMGGDYAPLEVVKGGIEALEKSSDLFLYLLGDEA